MNHNNALKWCSDSFECVTVGVLIPKDDKRCYNCEKKRKWNTFYIKVALHFASLSKDPKTKVGAVIVTPSGIVYPGYNGDEVGGTNERDSLEGGQSGFIHAEENSIIKFDPSIHKGSKMYLSHSPCKMCARRIVNTQAISAVYYAQEFREKDGITLLKDRGIRCELVNVEGE